MHHSEFYGVTGLFGRQGEYSLLVARLRLSVNHHAGAKSERRPAIALVIDQREALRLDYVLNIR